MNSENRYRNKTLDLKKNQTFIMVLKSNFLSFMKLYNKR